MNTGNEKTVSNIPSVLDDIVKAAAEQETQIVAWIKTDKLGNISPSNKCIKCESDSAMWFAITAGMSIRGPFCENCSNGDF